MQKKLMIGIGGLSVLLVIIAMSLLVRQLGLSPAGLEEKQIAHFEKDPKTFVNQVQANPGTYDENASAPIFDNQPVAISPPRVEPVTTPRVLGIDTLAEEAEKWIEVDLSDQQLILWKGDQMVKAYVVSTGMPGYTTVTGEFRIWRKVLLQGYRGGSKALGTYYYLPNVPYSLFFHNGYAIHAAYWHNDFGIRPRSHGCVNMRTEDAKEVYEWANPIMPVGARVLNSSETNPGTRIVIHD